MDFRRVAMVGGAGVALLTAGVLLSRAVPQSILPAAPAARHASEPLLGSARADAAPLAPEGDDRLLVAPAAREESKEARRFARLDRNDDGAVSQAEFLAARKRNFDKLDVNGDGKLSFEEYAAKSIEKFSEADANHDGKLSPAELATTAAKRKANPRCPPVQTAAAD